MTKNSTDESMPRWFRVLWVVVLVIGLIGALAYVWYIRPVFLAGNVRLASGPYRLEIPSGSRFADVMDKVASAGILKDTAAFRTCASMLGYGPSVKPGSYLLADGMRNLDLVRILRAGAQTPVKLTLNQVRTIWDLAGKVGRQIEPDSEAMAEAFRHAAEIIPEALPQADSLMCLFPANTYEVYWTLSPEDFLHRMVREYERFWTTERRAKALAHGLTPNQVVILASIVEKETRDPGEKPRVAGVYINRLHDGIPLQADPTVVFARGDFSEQRVLNRDLTIDSPYNTYLHPGLPPGPICMPDQSTVLATLNAEQHDYLYFCAAPDYSGKHLFSRTLAGHEANARTYRSWLNSQGIFR